MTFDRQEARYPRVALILLVMETFFSFSSNSFSNTFEMMMNQVYSIRNNALEEIRESEIIIQLIPFHIREL